MQLSAIEAPSTTLCVMCVVGAMCLVRAGQRGLVRFSAKGSAGYCMTACDDTP